MSHTKYVRSGIDSLRVTTPANHLDSDVEILTHHIDRRNSAIVAEMNVNCLALDYDGTIGTLTVSRKESKVPRETLLVLQRISELIPVIVNTTKDLSFVTARTPFAHAWSAISGLETRIGEQIWQDRSVEPGLADLAMTLKHAKSHIVEPRVRIEEKRDSRGRVVAFCVDWRQARDTKVAVKEAENVANDCETRGLTLIRYYRQPFFDVYPTRVDKGNALRQLAGKLGVEDGILYLGDSEVDNPAFEASDISLGVLHNENGWQNLVCDYFVRFEDVAAFLSKLLENKLLFDPGFPMIKTNSEKMRRQCTSA
jgi:hydroxymethylpyrimidine pyrophosphatase-like HAD family hydrolase